MNHYRSSLALGSSQKQGNNYLERKERSAKGGTTGGESIHVMRLFRKKKERTERKTESDTDKTRSVEKNLDVGPAAESRNNTMNEFPISVTLHEIITL